MKRLIVVLVLASSAALAKKAPPAIDNAARAAARDKPLAVGPRATHQLLLAVAEHESRFRADIARCAILGDRGRAHGSYQLHPEAFGSHTAAEICGSDRLQAQLALAALHANFNLHPELGVEGAVRGYASGNSLRRTRAAAEILQLWRARLARRR